MLLVMTPIKRAFQDESQTSFGLATTILEATLQGVLVAKRRLAHVSQKRADLICECPLCNGFTRLEPFIDAEWLYKSQGALQTGSIVVRRRSLSWMAPEGVRRKRLGALEAL